MQKIGEIGIHDLASLANIETPPGEPLSLATKMFDSDGDGQFDLFLLDGDNDGVVDGIVRGFDTNGDGANDLFAHYNEDGSVASVGRLDPETGELELLYEEPGFLDQLLESMGLNGSEPPDPALYTSFDDPYISETLGTFGEDVPEDIDFSLIVEPEDIQIGEEPAYDIAGVTVLEEPGTDADFYGESADRYGDDATGAEESAGSEAVTEEAPGEVDKVARVVELRDAGGGVDGSTLWARVDTDGDSLWDQEELVSKSGSAYLADIDHDGYSDEVATDLDGDGRIDSVNTTGKGSSSDNVAVSTVIAADSDDLIDKHPGDDDATAEAAATDDWQVLDTDAAEEGDGGTDTDSEYSSDSYDTGTDYSAPEPYDTDSTTDATDSTE